MIRKADNPIHTSKQGKVLAMLVPFFITPDRISGYEQFAEILTKKKSNQKKKGVNIQDNSKSYLRSINTYFIITIIVFNQKLNTGNFTVISNLYSSGSIYNHCHSGGWYHLVPFGGTIKERY
jgi:hypothetical protein